MLVIYNKFLFVIPYKVLNIDLATNAKYLISLLTSGNISYIYILLPGQDTTNQGQINKNNGLK